MKEFDKTEDVKRNITDVSGKVSERVLDKVRKVLSDKCGLLSGAGEPVSGGTTDGNRDNRDIEGIVVGLSGGPDSLCLLYMLTRIFPPESKDSLRITALHVNHCLRGEEADRDEAFCREICGRLGVELTVKRVNIAEIAAASGQSLEECGRHQRYNILFDECRERHFRYLAVGHNLEDNAETVLLNISRGTGTEGLRGIRYLREQEGISIIRPLRDVSRREIEAVCEENGLSPIHDSSNFEDDFRRNKIRLNIIPEIDRQLGISITDRINTLSELAAADNDFVEIYAKKAYNKSLCSTDESQTSLDTTVLMSFHPAVITRVIRIAYGSVSKSMVDFGHEHVSDILGLCSKGISGKQLDLPHDTIALYRYGRLIFRRRENAEKKLTEHTEKELSLFSTCNTDRNTAGNTDGITDGNAEECTVRLDAGHSIVVSILKPDQHTDDIGMFRHLRERPGTMYFDLDDLTGVGNGDNVVFRHRRQGDVFAPVTGGGSKKLKDFFIDMKIPREQRDELWLLAKGREIIWIVGVMPSDKCRVTESTGRICRLQVDMD